MCQPSFEVFGLSNKVVLLTAGRVAYCGPTEDVVAYFESPRLGFSSKDYSNPADFIIGVVSGAETSSTKQQ
jgi:hypothetical protein